MFLLTLAVELTRTRPQKLIEKCGGGEMLNLRMCVFI